MQELARDPRFIRGIYNYCDRWCERCPFSNRCLTFAMEQERELDDPSARDIENDKFWQDLEDAFKETIQMLQEETKKRGINLDDPQQRAEIIAQERAARRRAAKNRPITEAGEAYTKAVDGWMGNSKPLLAGKIEELKTQARLEIGDPKAEAEKLSDYTDVIRWYQHFIHIKLLRAVDSQAEEEAETDGAMERLPKDSDGTAKIALIAMDRSISAWAGLRESLGDGADGILDLLAQLTVLRRETEKLFPAARAFVRPGFDEPVKPLKPARVLRRAKSKRK